MGVQGTSGAASERAGEIVSASACGPSGRLVVLSVGSLGALAHTHSLGPLPALSPWSGVWSWCLWFSRGISLSPQCACAEAVSLVHALSSRRAVCTWARFRLLRASVSLPEVGIVTLPTSENSESRMCRAVPTSRGQVVTCALDVSLFFSLTLGSLQEVFKETVSKGQGKSYQVFS